MRVVALDPGGTTGYAEGDLDDGLMLIVNGQSKVTVAGLWASLAISKPDILICESFEFRRAARDNLMLVSCELIGVVKLYAELKEHNCVLHMQTASQGKGFFSDAKLKNDRLYRVAMPHANDATRHLLHWFQFGAGYKYNTRGYERGRG